MYKVIRADGNVIARLRTRPMAEELVSYLTRVLGRGYTVRKA